MLMDMEKVKRALPLLPGEEAGDCRAFSGCFLLLTNYRASFESIFAFFENFWGLGVWKTGIQ